VSRNFPQATTAKQTVAGLLAVCSVGSCLAAGVLDPQGPVGSAEFPQRGRRCLRCADRDAHCLRLALDRGQSQPQHDAGTRHYGDAAVDPPG
jgi:hypothetical protein